MLGPGLMDYLFQAVQSHMFVWASNRVGDSELDHLWGGHSGEGSMMLQDPKLPNDPED